MEEDELERTVEPIISAIANEFEPIRWGDRAVLLLRVEEVMHLLWFGVKSGSETNRVYMGTRQNSHEHNILSICSSRLERGLNLVLACSPSRALFVCVCVQRNNLSQWWVPHWNHFRADLLLNVLKHFKLTRLKGVIWCDFLFFFSLVCYVAVCACIRSADLQSSKSPTKGFIPSKREG